MPARIFIVALCIATAHASKGDEPPRLVERLRLALAIGGGATAAWPSLQRAVASMPHSPCTEPPVLAVGVITAPFYAMRRQRIRHARDLMLAW